MQMEWIRQRVFECTVIDAFGPCRKRVIVRHRDDGILYSLTVTIGHPYFDTRDYIVKEFAKFACQVVTVCPCDERAFHETFMLNLREYDGTEITEGNIYSFLKPDIERANQWHKDEWNRIPLQRFNSDPKDFPPPNAQHGLP